MRPPEPFTARPAASGDEAAAAELMNEFERAYVEEPDTVDAADVAEWWTRRAIERDTVLVHDPAGRLAATGLLKEEGGDVLDLDGYVHPDFVGRRLGGFLLDWAEEEAVRRGRPVVRTACLAADPAAGPLIEGRGFVPVRHFYRMAIQLDGPPPEQAWPDGFEVSVFRPGEEPVLRAVLEEVFADHWGHEPEDLEEWQRTVFACEWWDPSLVYLVRHGGEVVAAAINAIRFGSGFVDQLGTRARWRGRGLGRVLLLTAFGEFHRRGESRITLTVDAGNETGATHLYESVGMHVACQYDVYDKRR